MFETKGDYDKFNSIEEFIDNLSRGGEIEFLFNNRKYSITHTENQICILRAYDYSTEKLYNKLEDILAYEIDGYRLGDIVTKIQPVFRCF